MTEMPIPEAIAAFHPQIQTVPAQPEPLHRRQSYTTADGVLHFYTEDNKEICVPVRAKTRVFRQMENMESLDSLFFLLESTGAENIKKQIEELDIAETAELVAQWGAEFEKRIQKAMNRKALSAGE